MKKMCLLGLFLLAGCSNLQLASRPNTINGETCMQSSKLRVLQVIDDGILAYLCPTDSQGYSSSGDSWYDCVMHGDTVFMPVAPTANDYVDEQKVTLTKTQCFVADGTFKYPRKNGVIATVRKIKILNESSSANGL